MNEEMVVVAVCDDALLAVARSLLDDAGIRYEVRNDMLTMTRHRPPIEVLVRREDSAAASELLADLKPTPRELANPLKGLPFWCKVVYVMLVIGTMAIFILLAWLQHHNRAP